MLATPLLAATVLALLCEYCDPTVSNCFPLSEGSMILLGMPLLGCENGSSLARRNERSLSGLLERSGFPMSSWAGELTSLPERTSRACLCIF